MTAIEKRNYKIKLHQYAVEIIRGRIAEIMISIENAQASANSEEKSSAGDKYETSRAIGHLQKDMHAKQLAANNRELAALLSIDCEMLYHSVTAGCVLSCSSFSFFIAAGLGKINFEGENIYFLSPGAPFTRSILHKKTGDIINFNNEKMMINAIY